MNASFGPPPMLRYLSMSGEGTPTAAADVETRPAVERGGTLRTLMERELT